ncbi:ERF family protein [Myxococcus sp. CA039A]|uniref:ERF family protein n=1 Tax=Myxococcus sp. CA039A TaxID=2741737 RepID=UPI00157A87A2|nr:ERF family protein [Myxococcus sp. CA039A]NTX57951.1 ERF family protein [Myxococcus sp. CA039A]
MTESSTSTSQPGKPSLIRKLAEVMGTVGHVPKSGRNTFHNYDYATEADIVAAVRKGLSDRSLMLIPSVEKTEWSVVERAKGGKDRLCTLTVRYTLHDGDSGETLAFDVVGEGQDAGDKATYKAITGATKYALLKLFLIPTGDDPEQDEGHGQRGGPQRQRGGQQDQGQQQARPQSGQQRGGSQGQQAHGQQQGQQRQGSQQGQPARPQVGQRPQQDASPEQGERRAPSPAPRDARPTQAREPVDARTAAALDDPHSPAAASFEFEDCIGFGTHKNVKRADATVEQLSDSLVEGSFTLKNQPDLFNARALRRAMEACEDELTLRTKTPPLPPLVAFGPHKGKAMTTLSVSELTASINLAQANLTKSPKAEWVADVRANMEALLAELGRRPKDSQLPPGQGG